MPTNNSVWTRMRLRHFVLITGKTIFFAYMLSSCKHMSISFANSVEEPLEPLHDKTNNVAVRPAKIRSAWASAQSDQSLGIRPVWSESSLSTWRKVGTLATLERTAKALKCPRLNLFEAFNVIAIKLVVILNHFPGDKTVFYGIYLTLFVFVLTQFSLSNVPT